MFIRCWVGGGRGLRRIGILGFRFCFLVLGNLWRGGGVLSYFDGECVYVVIIYFIGVRFCVERIF